jgi:osmoprotectant transport system ATP-binding protein
LGFQKTPALPLKPEPTVRLGATAAEVQQAGARDGWLLVVDGDGHPLGWVEPVRVTGQVTSESLHRGGTVTSTIGNLRNALDAALSSPSRRGVVVDATGALVGTVRAHEVLAAIEEVDRPEAVVPDDDSPGRQA